MRLTAPFNPTHLSIREVAGVSVTIQRFADQSIVDVEHPDAIALLRRQGFAPLPVDVWVAETAFLTVDGIRRAVAEFDDLQRLNALLDAEINGRNRASAIAAIRRRRDEIEGRIR